MRAATAKVLSPYVLVLHVGTARKFALLDLRRPIGREKFRNITGGQAPQNFKCSKQCFEDYPLLTVDNVSPEGRNLCGQLSLFLLLSELPNSEFYVAFQFVFKKGHKEVHCHYII